MASPAKRSDRRLSCDLTGGINSKQIVMQRVVRIKVVFYYLNLPVKRKRKRFSPLFPATCQHVENGSGILIFDLFPDLFSRRNYR
jgi:hypothetical protein